MAFYPHDKFFSGFGLTSGLLGSPPSVRLLPGVVQSPPGQSPLLESQVGAQIAIGIVTAFSTLQAALPIFSFAATSFDSLVRSSVLAPPHALTL